MADTISLKKADRCLKHITHTLTFKIYSISSGVARAFPGGRLAHPEGQNEEENK